MNTPGHRERNARLRATVFGLGALLSIASASAQYAFDTPGHNHDEEGVRYFGSAKDDQGALLADVTFLLESDHASFVFVTNADGRFRGTLPLDIPTTAVTAKCWKDGLQSLRINQRPGPKTAKRSTVQVDCVLRRVTAS